MTHTTREGKIRRAPGEAAVGGCRRETTLEEVVIREGGEVLRGVVPVVERRG